MRASTTYLGTLAKGATDNLDHTSELAGKASTLIRRDDDGGESCRFRRTRRRAGASGGHGQAGVSYAVGLITPPTNGDLANALVGSTALDSIESPTCTRP